MAVIPLYRELSRALREGRLPHPEYFAGLEETYGSEVFGPGGVRGALAQVGPGLVQALEPAGGYAMEERAQRLLDQVASLLPIAPPDLYLATLLFIAPAATLSMQGRPVIALGLERFSPKPPSGGEKVWYHPAEAAEMIPHEAAHAARMQVLGLPCTPRRLSLLDMVMLEGTALTFTDLLLGRETLATFMPPQALAWHRAHDADVRTQAAAEFETSGMPAFLKYFSREAPVSGYYVGYSLCREYLDRYGAQTMPELLTLPADEILRRLGGEGI